MERWISNIYEVFEDVGENRDLSANIDWFNLQYSCLVDKK